jgi:probable H4MPT-linked C1 transfer pathway protein
VIAETSTDLNLSDDLSDPSGEMVGWDIGGANIKAARWSDGQWQVVQQPFAIWQRRDELIAALASISARLGVSSHAAVTITAELSDAFRTKREGITFVLDALRVALPETKLHIFGLDGQFHDLQAAYHNHMLVAAANWLATAVVVSRHFADCLLVDVGSTTTDIIPIQHRRVVAKGRHDPGRLVKGELLYTGALRTPVQAMVNRLPLWGSWCPVAAELFATIQDVHLLLDSLTPEESTSPTADGRPATAEFAAERLARVVCADIEMLTGNDIDLMARHIAAEQVRQISEAIMQVFSGSNVQGPVVAVGVGAFLAQAAAVRLEIPCQSSAKIWGDKAGDVAPAAAVAMLLSETLDHV